MFSEAEQIAIREKTRQLKSVQEGKTTPKELDAQITQRRLDWIEENLETMLKKYGHLPPEEQAFNIIFFDHMGINPDHVKMTRISETKIRTDSYSFCPYLEACSSLNLDTKVVCKEMLEVSVKKMVKVIHPKLEFSRNYSNLRPYQDFCEEYIEFTG
jgi:hypothetical protein